MALHCFFFKLSLSGTVTGLLFSYLHTLTSYFSCPAVSHTLNFTIRSLPPTSMRRILDRKEAPIVVSWLGVKVEVTKERTRDVLPTPEEPNEFRRC